MRRPLRQLALILLVLALASVVVRHGIVPAMSRLDTDFPNYYTAAKIVADGGQVERLYDDRWFQEQMSRYGMPAPGEGKFAPFPPPTALLLLPLASLEPLNALRISVVISLLCLVASVVLLSKILSRSVLEAAVLVLASGTAIASALRFGQPYLVVSLSCVLGYYCYRRGRPLLAGICFGLFVPIKYFPIVFLVYFACRREWKLVLAGAATILAIGVGSVAILGWNIHVQFLQSVLGKHLSGDLGMQGRFAAGFQSFDSLLHRLFVYDASANPHPWLVAPQFELIAVPLIKLAVLGVALAALLRLGRRADAASVAPSIGLLGVMVLLLAPATASYHFTLLWLPVALLVDAALRQRAPLVGYLILALYALIGFFPYRFTQPFEGQGGLSALAYPRLWLMLASFLAAIGFMWRLGSSETECPARS